LWWDAPRLARWEVSRESLVHSLWYAQPYLDVMGMEAKARCHFFHCFMSRIGVYLALFNRLSVIFHPRRFH
jgi:hypothetical protein